MSRREHRILIGRARECDVVLADLSVSRQHAELVRTAGGQWLLVDRRSQNGTAVRAGDRFVAISQEVVTPETVVRFGDVSVVVGELIRGDRARLAESGPRPAPADPDAPTA